MPSIDQLADPPRKGKIIKSAFDSDSWESDGTIHVDGLVGSATISPSGRDIALASPDGLAIIDLDSPYNPPRRLRSHGQPWLVTDVQWSPFAARDYWVVSTANHRALVWNLNLREDSNTGAIEHSLQGHSRAITDINFSAHHPDKLATCSVDGYVHLWDLRRPRQPVQTFCDWFAGATQVKYSRQQLHIIASSHDRWLHIWDERRPCEPLKSISAHKSKIYGLDWNRVQPTSLITCSLDKSIKFWDYTNDDNQPEHVIHTDYPVWRARHTPFGWGLLAMPQNEPGDLYLYDRKAIKDMPRDVAVEPVNIFPGHGQNKVKEFLWRSRGGITNGTDERDFQLVSWGTDNELRLQCVDANVLASVGYTKGKPAEKGISETRKGAAYKTFRTVDEISNRDRKLGKMSDTRVGGYAPQRQSALTLGMRSGPQGRHARAGWRGPSMKAKVKATKDRNQSQIGWLKGITMTKRRTTSDIPKRQMSKDSSVFGHGYPDDGWGDPDTVQEELLRISTQIPKIKWENIDMDELTINASLNGPWGVEGETIFMKVKIDLPEDYPKTSAPKFFIERTPFLPAETHKRITTEIHQLAEQFLRRKQNCLEVAFTYLLGEVDLESSTTFFKNVRDLEDGLDDLEDDSSSEDDEDIPAGGSATMSQELTPHVETETALAPTNRAIIPPPPRTCGARFSLDGRLICFFPSKEEKARALFSSAVDTQKDRPRGEPFFAGFGRIAHEPAPRNRHNPEDASATEDQSDSDDSMASSSSSSDSESTSIHKLNLWYRPSRQLRKTWSEDRSVRSSGGGTGTGAGTGTGTGISRRRIGRPRNRLCIHDLRPLLPSKKELAREYVIFGDGADVCEQNAAVAERHGYAELADVWRYLTLLLRKGIPLEVLQQDHRGSSILVIAHDVVSKCHGFGCQTDHAESPENNDPCLSGRVKWGQHPLARDFIADLLDYFDKISDIQMLAMLSCIFSESFTEDSVAYIESQMAQPETPLPMKAPSFSLDYYPTDASAWTLYGKSRDTSAITTPRTPQTPYYAGSQASDDGLWRGEPESNSFSCGETPPHYSRSYLGEKDAAPSRSRSPHSQNVPRSAAMAVASTFSTALPRSFTGDSSASPPSHSKKKASPAEATLSTLAQGVSSVTWGSGATVDSSGGRTSLSDDEFPREDFMPMIPVSVSVFVEDQTVFDDDGWLSTPLLEPNRASVYASYRYAYAEMLQMWEEPLARLEIMKFNVLKENMRSVQLDSSPIILGKKDQLQSLLASGRGLDVTGMCRVHETQLEPLRYTSSHVTVGGAVGTCARCHIAQRQLRCVYCLEPVDALFPPCLSCGCASHETCLAEWHAAGESLCPAGDECNCIEEAMNGQVESWTALLGAMKGMKGLPTLPPAAMNDESEDKGGTTKRTGRSLDVPVLDEPRDDGNSAQPPSLSIGRLRKTAGSWSRASSLKRNGKKST
jgi:WD40 repeat protein